MQLLSWVDQYGYVVLFVALLLELLALPFPGEVLMGYAGFLVFEGKLNWGLSILMGSLGSAVGMSIAYWIGFKLGTPFFHKYGQRIHFGPEKLEKTSRWFERFGNKLLLIAYFIPGVRHFTGYFSGITKIPFKKYGLFAFPGAFIWVSSFISLGKILGPKWEQFHSSLSKYLIIGSIIAGILVTVIYLYRSYKVQIKEFMLSTLNKLVHTFHSLGRVRVLVTVTAAIFLGLILFMFGLIQDFLANEFVQFNTVVTLLVQLIFNESRVPLENAFYFFTSFKVLLPLIFIAMLWITVKGKNRMIEYSSLLTVVIGGEIFEEGIRRLFHWIVNMKTMPQIVPYSFPSEQAIMTMIIYGFISFMLMRHSKSILVRVITPISILIILCLVALGPIIFGTQYPSDIVAGYVFGGIWVSLNILLLEIFRLMRNTRYIQ